MSEPYLSVVVATRNDDHGGDPLKRLQAFVNTFAAQCRRYGLDAELLVVEWNPPGDKPRVSELCRVPDKSPLEVRFIEVPADRHQELRFASVLPLFQMIAKNVGIRRARGRFILATNIDVIFSNELVERLAARNLSPDLMYRVDRHDIEPNYPVEGTLAEQMAYCATHHLRLHTRFGTYPVDAAGRMTSMQPDIVGPGVSFESGWHIREGDLKYGHYRWAAREASLAINRRGTNERGAMLDIELEPNPYQPDSWVDLEVLDGAQSLARARVARRLRLRVPLPDGRPSHAIVLRLLDSSGGYDRLPLFEARGETFYRVFRVVLGPLAVYDGDMAQWRRASNNNPQLTLRHGGDGIEIASDPGSYSYCAQYGPFEAPADQTYEFLLEYVPVSGQVAFKMMDDEHETWIAAQPFEVVRGDVHMMGLSVALSRGTRFSLVVANNLAAGGVSRCVLRRIVSSVPFEQLMRRDAPPQKPGLGVVLFDVAARPFRSLKSAVSTIEKRRAERFQEKIADESSRVRELEARLAELAPLGDLQPLAALLRTHRPTPLHQNACGDFQLLAREHWLTLRGYPEFEMFSMGLDGLFESIAHAAGIRECIFEMPLCAYHLEHEKGSGWTPEGEAALRKRIAESGITWLDATSVHIWTMYMQWLRRPMIFNGSDWGLADASLRETVLGPAVHAGERAATGDAG